MRHPMDPDTQNLRRLAEQLDCFCEADHLLLSGWTEETARSKRKRGEGPAYILHGRNYLYPRKQYAEYLHARVHERRPVNPRGVL